MRALALALTLALTTGGCQHSEEIQRYRFSAFGTDITVSIRAGSTEAQAAVASINREFRTLHDRWHAWRPGLLGKINRSLAAGESIELAAGELTVIRRAIELERLSGGLFNPAIGRLLALWGFHADELPEGPPPDAAAITNLVNASPSMADLRIEGRKLSSRNRLVQLDFGAYIKGVAVERALRELASAGIEHAIVNAGGDLGVIGRQRDRAWRAAVEHPDGRGDRYLASLAVEPGEFVFTSGNYRRYRQDEGLRYGHIIDPRDGYPVDAVSSVTVITRSGGLADAAATALAVASAEEWPVIAWNMGVELVLRVDADGTISVTPAMASRIRWQGEAGPGRTVSLPR